MPVCCEPKAAKLLFCKLDTTEFVPLKVIWYSTKEHPVVIEEFLRQLLRTESNSNQQLHTCGPTVLFHSYCAGHCFNWSSLWLCVYYFHSNRKHLPALELFLRGTYIRNIAVVGYNSIYSSVRGLFLSYPPLTQVMLHRIHNYTHISRFCNCT